MSEMCAKCAHNNINDQQIVVELRKVSPEFPWEIKGL